MTTPALSIPKEANPLRGLSDFGQSVWLDYIRRSLITSGELKRLIVEDGLRGVTSNPSIFEKAIVGSTDYESGPLTAEVLAHAILAIPALFGVPRVDPGSQSTCSRRSTPHSPVPRRRERKRDRRRADYCRRG